METWDLSALFLLDDDNTLPLPALPITAPVAGSAAFPGYVPLADLSAAGIPTETWDLASLLLHDDGARVPSSPPAGLFPLRVAGDREAEYADVAALFAVA
jgi:hypothetical protein